MKKVTFLTFFVVALLLAGCDDTPQKSGNASGTQQTAPETETGRFALQKMLPAARMWGGDSKPIRLQSDSLGGVNGQNGKSGFWRAQFGSPGRQKTISYIWSGISGPDTTKGISHSTEDSYNPSNRSEQGFDLAFLKIDSDEAFEVAQKHGGKELLAKDPKQDVIYVLDWNANLNELNWHVIYGNSPSSAKLTVTVNASDGKFVHKE